MATRTDVGSPAARAGAAVRTTAPGQVTPSVRLLATPGHTAQDITTLVETAEGLVACTHLWWSQDGPDEDPRAEDQDILERSRAALLALQPVLIVPGHGAPFRPDQLTRWT